MRADRPDKITKDLVTMDDREKLISQITKIYFPILLKSKFKTTKINKNILIKRINAKDCQEVLGIKNVKFEFNTDGMIEKISNSTNPQQKFRSYMPYFSDPLININLSRVNFVLIVNARAEAEKFQQALKLISPHSYSGISIGFGKTNFMYGVFHIEPTPCYGKEIFELSKESKISLSKIIAKLIALEKDRKLFMIFKKYLYALSSENLPESLRFLELAIILEMLLLPDNDKETLSYKFRLRFAKLFKKYDRRYSKSDIVELYNDGKLIYDIRSKIVHKGSDDRAKSFLDKLIRYSQLAILTYIEDGSLFTEPKLDRICLD